MSPTLRPLFQSFLVLLVLAIFLQFWPFFLASAIGLLIALGILALIGWLLFHRWLKRLHQQMSRIEQQSHAKETIIHVEAETIENDTDNSPLN